jgi:hypothetical protein
MEKPKEESCKWGPMIDLRAVEEDVLAEGRDWMRRRMEQKLREAAAFSPGGGKKANRRSTTKIEAEDDERRGRPSDDVRP